MILRHVLYHDDVEILLSNILQGNLFNCNKVSILQVQTFINSTISSFPNLISQHLLQISHPNKTISQSKIKKFKEPIQHAISKKKKKTRQYKPKSANEIQELQNIILSSAFPTTCVHCKHYKA